jgi:hypothetical protein
MTLGILLILIIVAFLALLIFVPFVRSIISALIRTGFLLLVVFLAVFGSSMLLNNETVFDRPGWKLRAARFLTVDWAATSVNGKGDAPCTADKHAVESKPETPAETHQTKGKKKKEAGAQVAAASEPTATPTPAGQAEDENLYDELMTRNYICEGDTPVAIPRAKLLEMVQQTITELKGWKLASTDPRTGMLNCVYSTRVLGFEDDVKIVVTPHSDVELCSQSKKGEPGSHSVLGFFHGDFGANIGHIKEFYAALKPKTDLYCKELEQKQKPKNPNQ